MKNRTRIFLGGCVGLAGCGRLLAGWLAPNRERGDRDREGELDGMGVAVREGSSAEFLNFIARSAWNERETANPPALLHPL